MHTLKRFFKHHSNLHMLLVVGSVVMVWRGLWGLMDLYLFPNDPLVSYLTSVFGGIFFLMLIDNFNLKDLD